MRQIGRRGLALVGVLALSLASTSVASAGIPSAPPGPAVDDAYDVNEDEILEVGPPGVLANDPLSTEASCAAATDTSALAGQGLLSPDGQLTFTPNANFNGTTSFTYGLMLIGAEGCPGPYDDDAIVTLTVHPVNDAPSAVADSFQALVNRTLNVNAPGVLRNDSDIDGDDLTAVKVSNPAHGVVVLAADGSFGYTPSAGYVGPDAFAYRASDGDATSPIRIVSLTVTAVPLPTATPAPTPTSPPSPTPVPTPTGEASPSPSAEAAASIDPIASAVASAAPPTSPTATPASSAEPGPVDEEGGLSLPVLLVVVLLAVLMAFGAAFLVSRWLAAQRTGGEIDES